VTVEIRYVSGYERRVRRMLDPEERAAMEAFIAAAPERHPVIPGTGGFRKARWRREGRGKRGGVRVIYFFVSARGVVYFADIYAKNEKENLTAADQALLKQETKGIQERTRREDEERKKGGKGS
jgi:hypothetical protein